MRSGRQFDLTLMVFPKLYFLEREGKALGFVTFNITISRNHFNLLVYWRDRPYFKHKQIKNIAECFDLLAFLFFYPMFLLYYFVFWQNQEGLIISEAAIRGVP